MQKMSFKLRPQWCWGLGFVLLVAACWVPLRQLKKMESLHASADRQLLQVNTLAAQARSLKSEVLASTGDRSAQLQSAVRQSLGTEASIRVQEHSATMSFSNVPAAEFAKALEHIRQNAYVRFTASKLASKDGMVSGSVDMQLAVVP